MSERFKSFSAVMLLLTREKGNNEEILSQKRKNTGYIYYNGYFKANEWIGEPIINEPQKNEELKWININDLSSNIVDDRVIAIHDYKNNIKYSEYCW